MAPRDVPQFRIVCYYPLPPHQVFRAIVEELDSALRRRGWKWISGKRGAIRPIERRAAAGEGAQTLRWLSDRSVMWQWKGRTSTGLGPHTVELRVAPHDGGAELSLAHSGGTDLLGEPFDEQFLGWFSSEILAATLLATDPRAMNAWRTDRMTRRPSGRTSRAAYEDPIYHRPNFAAILQGLSLQRTDWLLEVGCGGGAFLKQALKSGCRASGIDHSHDLLEVAAEQNAGAIALGQLQLKFGDAADLPFPDGRFTCAVMTGVLGFLPDPFATFREIARTLTPGGRLAVYSGTKKMYGTPAAGPRTAGGVRFYEKREVTAFARSAGFSSIRVDHPDLRPFAKAAKVPAEAMYLFGPEYSQILWASKPGGASPKDP
ncbi:MAG: class I SAM-dependent methyltransferase [Thermoplasmata archaeon]